jgi:putative ABC transport system substrate-binding protein
MEESRRRLLGSMGFVLVAPAAVRAQSRRVPRIGAVIHSGPYLSIAEGLRAGLKGLGVTEGRDFTLDLVDAKGDVKAIAEAARRFERERVELIYCAPTSAVIAVKKATSAIPVFFCAGTDPIALGLVNSFAKPGGRLTGLYFLSTDLTAKRLELLKDMMPKLHRVVIFYNPNGPATAEAMRLARSAGEKLKVKLIERHAPSERELRAAVAALKPGEADALFMISDALVTSQAQLLIDKANRLRMPTMTQTQTLVERGALASYGVDYHEIGRESANNVQRMLRGAGPGDLPVETVSRLAFVLNRRTAREIGFVVPPAMMVRFDRVIE